MCRNNGEIPLRELFSVRKNFYLIRNFIVPRSTVRKFFPFLVFSWPIYLFLLFFNNNPFSSLFLNIKMRRSWFTQLFIFSLWNLISFLRFYPHIQDITISWTSNFNLILVIFKAFSFFYKSFFLKFYSEKRFLMLFI